MMTHHVLDTMSLSLGIFSEHNLANELISHIFSFIDFASVEQISSINVVLREIARRSVTILDVGVSVSVNIFKMYPNLNTVYPIVVVKDIEELNMVLSVKLDWVDIKIPILEDIDPVVSYINSHSPRCVNVEFGKGFLYYYRLPGGRYYLDFRNVNPGKLHSLHFNAVNYHSIVPSDKWHVPSVLLKEYINDWEKITGHVVSDINTLCFTYMRCFMTDLFEFLKVLPEVDTLICHHDTNAIADIVPQNPIETIRHLLIPLEPKVEIIRLIIKMFPRVETLGIRVDPFMKKKQNMESDITTLERELSYNFDPWGRCRISRDLARLRDQYSKLQDVDPVTVLQTLYPKITFVLM